MNISLEQSQRFHKAFRSTKQIVGLYNRETETHLIMDSSKLGTADNEPVWALKTSDYEAGHAAQMDELDRLRLSAALQELGWGFAILGTPKPEAPKT